MLLGGLSFPKGPPAPGDKNHVLPCASDLARAPCPQLLCRYVPSLLWLHFLVARVGRSPGAIIVLNSGSRCQGSRSLPCIHRSPEEMDTVLSGVSICHGPLAPVIHSCGPRTRTRPRTLIRFQTPRYEEKSDLGPPTDRQCTRRGLSASEICDIRRWLWALQGAVEETLVTLASSLRDETGLAPNGKIRILLPLQGPHSLPPPLPWLAGLKQA